MYSWKRDSNPTSKCDVIARFRLVDGVGAYEGGLCSSDFFDDTSL